MARLPEGWKIIGVSTASNEKPTEREITEEEVDRLIGLGRGLSFIEEVHATSEDNISCAQAGKTMESIWDLLNKRRSIPQNTTPEQSI